MTSKHGFPDDVTCVLVVDGLGARSDVIDLGRGLGCVFPDLACSM